MAPKVMCVPMISNLLKGNMGCFYYVDISINGDETLFSCGNLPGLIEQKKCKYSRNRNDNICFRKCLYDLLQ